MSILTEITRISGNISDALTAIGNKGVTVPAGSNSDDLATLITAIPTADGSGTEGQTVTGTVTGTGDNILEIPCTFEPDVIYVYGDMSEDVTNRGIVSMTIVKDTVVYMSVDTSSSNADEFASAIHHNIVNYNETDTTTPHASYSDGILSLDSAILNSSSGRWRSGQTYNYKFVKWT